MSDLSKAIFHNETLARQWLEAELWPNGPVCPHCGVVNEATLMQGKSHRPGLYNCNACREPFTVTVGSLYERSKVPLHKWLAATHLLMASKKGMRATGWPHVGHQQKNRMVPLSSHPRVASANQSRNACGDGKTVEVDESFVGGLEKNKHRSKRKHQGTGGTGKEVVIALVERGGRVRSHHIPEVTAKTLGPILERSCTARATYTDEGGAMKKAAGQFDAGQTMINHTYTPCLRSGMR